MNNDENKKCNWCKSENCKCPKCMRFLTILIFVIILGLFINMGIKSYANATNPRTITINGKGEVFATPDISTINFTIRATKKDDNTASLQDEVSKKMSSIQAKLIALGIQEKDVQTVNYYVNPKYDYTNSGTNLTGYEAAQNVNIKVRDTLLVPKVLNILAEEKITEVSGPNFEVDNVDSLKDGARDIAIKDAKEKAKALAKSLDVRIKKIVSFSDDGSVSNPMPAMYEQKSMMGMGGSPAMDANLPAGENKIVSNVSITFQIED